MGDSSDVRDGDIQGFGIVALDFDLHIALWNPGKKFQLSGSFTRSLYAIRLYTIWSSAFMVGFLII